MYNHESYRSGYEGRSGYLAESPTRHWIGQMDRAREQAVATPAQGARLSTAYSGSGVFQNEHPTPKVRWKLWVGILLVAMILFDIFGIPPGRVKSNLVTKTEVKKLAKKLPSKPESTETIKLNPSTIAEKGR